MASSSRDVGRNERERERERVDFEWKTDHDCSDHVLRARNFKDPRRQRPSPRFPESFRGTVVLSSRYVAHAARDTFARLSRGRECFFTGEGGGEKIVADTKARLKSIYQRWGLLTRGALSIEIHRVSERERKTAEELAGISRSVTTERNVNYVNFTEEQDGVSSTRRKNVHPETALHKRVHATTTIFSRVQ